jgi:hypothetical protein
MLWRIFSTPKAIIVRPVSEAVSALQSFKPVVDIRDRADRSVGTVKRNTAVRRDQFELGCTLDGLVPGAVLSQEVRSSLSLKGAR